MPNILVAGEDALCCALGEKIIETALPAWRLVGPAIDTGGVTKLISAMPRYAKLAKHVHSMLCIADTDGKCPAILSARMRPLNAPESLLLRLAVAEAESWLLADREKFSTYFQVSANTIPRNPDDIPDPKALVLTILAKSKRRQIRTEVISRTDASKKGAGYNIHLCEFVRGSWNAQTASQASPSLARALRRLLALS